MKTIEVSAAIIRKENKILSTARGYGEFKGMWEFPGGKRQEDETFEEAIVREIKEELNADINVEKHIITVEYDYETFHLTMHCFLCNLIDNKFELLEHLDAKWLSYKELDNVSWLPADIIVVNAIKKDRLI